MNLRGLRADDVPVIHASVSDMVPKCVAVPVTTQSLSGKFSFAPKKVSPLVWEIGLTGWSYNSSQGMDGCTEILRFCMPLPQPE